MLPENITINPPEFDAVAAYGIGAIATLMAVVCVIVYAQGNRRRAILLALGTAAWMALGAAAAVSGLLSRFDIAPPPMLVMIAAVFAAAFAVGCSPLGRILARQTSLATLVGLQSFRFPLELVMHHAGDRAIMPVQLSFSGYNFDIVTGLGAILLFILIKSRSTIPNAAVWIWNIWGMFCLLAIAIIAVATSPVARAFGDEAKNLNTWVLFFPYVWLPVVLVTIAVSGHIVISRKLLTQ
jgi:hypothetical protein